MKHIIGIDTGTNSTGWALTKENDNGIDLIDIGVCIFPIGTNVDAQSNAETTKNEQRRIYRGMKRNLFRYKLRRKKLKKMLNDLGMLPDFNQLLNAKGKKQSTDLYELRANGIEKLIELKDIGRIFILLNKYRGFKTNAKNPIIDEGEIIDKKQEEENRKVEEGIKQLTEYIKESGAETIGKYFYLLHQKAEKLYKEGRWHNPNELIDERAINKESGEIVLYNSRGIRRQFGRYVGRELYQREFDLIWKAQKAAYAETHPTIFTGSAEEYAAIKQLKCEDKNQALQEFKKTNYWQIRNYCIYYQRPLRSQKKYLSNCQFEKNKKVIPASHPLFQEFRIWKNLADIRYNCEQDNILNQRLPLPWKKTIAEYLKTNEKILISKPKKGNQNEDSKYLIDLLPEAKPTTVFKTEDEENEKYINGNLTYSALFKALGEEKFNELRADNKLEKLWHHLYMAKDDEWLKDTLLCKWRFDEDYLRHEEIVNNLIGFELENDYGSYSAKLIKKILPFMFNDKDEYDALVLANHLKSPDEVKEEIKLSDKITQLKYQELRNPVVEKSVSQVIKIVNAILEKYKNQINRSELEIRIESTRELKKPRQKRESILRDIRKKDSERQVRRTACAAQDVVYDLTSKTLANK